MTILNLVESIPGPSLTTRVVSMFDQWWCGLFTHDTVRKCQGTRMFLACVKCGHESTGWTITPRVR